MRVPSQCCYLNAMAQTKASKKTVEEGGYGAYKGRRLSIYFDSVGDLEVVRNAAGVDKLAVSRFIVRLAIAEANRILARFKSGL